MQDKKPDVPVSDDGNLVIVATPEYVKEAIAEHAASRNHPDATLQDKGFVVLSNDTGSDSETMAATPKAVKEAYDLANTANQNALNNNSNLYLEKKQNGADIPDTPTFVKNIGLEETQNLVKRTINSSGNWLSVGDESKWGWFGKSDNDIYVANSKSNKYLKLKDDGRLSYNDSEIVKQTDFGIGSSELVNTNFASYLWNVAGDQPSGFYGYTPDSHKDEKWGSFIKLRYNANNQQYLIFPNYDENAMRIVRFIDGNSWTDYTVWTTGNTTQDGSGYLRKSSPIIKIWNNGKFETNDESKGGTVEHLSEGVYLIKNIQGFNVDGAWGGIDNGIDIPLCKNKLPLIWVNHEVLSDGSIKLMTYHREHSDAPAFARNIREGYADGDLIDIPDGRFVSVRVQMPDTIDKES